METAQMVLLLVLAVAIALALYFIAVHMIASAPVPDMYVDGYNTFRLQNAVVVAVQSKSPANVTEAWLLNGTEWLQASACNTNISELLITPSGFNCTQTAYFYLYFPYALQPGKYVLRVEATFGYGLQNYTTSFVLG